MGDGHAAALPPHSGFRARTRTCLACFSSHGFETRAVQSAPWDPAPRRPPGQVACAPHFSGLAARRVGHASLTAHARISPVRPVSPREDAQSRSAAVRGDHRRVCGLPFGDVSPGVTVLPRVFLIFKFPRGWGSEHPNPSKRPAWAVRGGPPGALLGPGARG